VSVLLFSAHSDDAVLFACYSVLAHEDCHVVNVLRSQLQENRGTGVTQEMRHAEDINAMDVLGVGVFEQWAENDANPDWDAITQMMIEIRETENPRLVIAPLPEIGGHDQHNAVGQLVENVFADREVKLYATYKRGQARSQVGIEVKPEPWMISVKLHALSCYGSQIAEPSTQAWFYDLLDMREWLS
jgi:LmbE family N-acetylglucosaminyl deacetylase